MNVWLKVIIALPMILLVAGFIRALAGRERGKHLANLYVALSQLMSVILFRDHPSSTLSETLWELATEKNNWCLSISPIRSRTLMSMSVQLG